MVDLNVIAVATFDTCQCHNQNITFLFVVLKCKIKVEFTAKMSIEAENRALTSTPSSTTSGCLSGDEAEDTLPSNLAHEELQLALNKVFNTFTG